MLKKILVLLFFILIIQGINTKNLSDIILLNGSDYETILKDGKKLILKTDGKIIIDNYEYNFIEIEKRIGNHLKLKDSEYYYDLTSLVFFNYKNYIYLDLGFEGEYATGFQVVIDYNKKKLITLRSFIYNPIKEIFGYNNYLIIIGLEKIEIFNLLKERFQYQGYLNNKVDKVTTNKDELDIIFKNKSIKKFTYSELILLNNLEKYLKPVIDSLRFRKYPSTEGKFIRNLKKGEKLELLEIGMEETINGVKGNWVKVKTEKGEIGWCFDAYLEEVKQDDVKKN